MGYLDLASVYLAGWTCALVQANLGKGSSAKIPLSRDKSFPHPVHLVYMYASRGRATPRLAHGARYNVFCVPLAQGSLCFVKFRFRVPLYKFNFPNGMWTRK